MVKRIELPSPSMEQYVGEMLPFAIVRRIALNITNFEDLVNFSLVNKSCCSLIQNDPQIWVNFLRNLDVWAKNNKLPSSMLLSRDRLNKITPLNCLNFKINDASVAKTGFTKIYSIMDPIVNDLLVDNYDNFQNSNIILHYNTPLNQAKLFSSIANFLIYYKAIDSAHYNSLVMRFSSILNLFINSIINEIDIQLKSRNYKTVQTLILSLDYLIIKNQNITIDPLESLLEYFINKFNDDYTFLSDDSLVNTCFQMENILNKTEKRGVVKGYSFNFTRINEILDMISTVLNRQIEEVTQIFSTDDITESSSNPDNFSTKLRSNIDEIPIILKVLENFLSNYLIGGFFDRVISRAKRIDSSDGMNMKTANTLLDEAWAPESSKADGENVTQEQNVEENSNINLMNETFLLFQSVPYIYHKLLQSLNGLNYPKTEIILSNSEKTEMNYTKVASEFVNFYYDQYLIEFSSELPKQCHLSIIHLISSWSNDNEKVQKDLEHEIMNLVIEDEDDSKKFNFELFNTFTNLFNFKKSKDVKAEPSVDDAEDNTKFTKMAAKLKILTAKVETLKNLISLDLTVLLLQHIKNSYDLLLGLIKFSATEQLTKQIYAICSDIFNDMLILLVNNHIKPGFNEALMRLKNFKPIEVNDHSNDVLEPVNNFIELVDVGDLILQMINVFYNNELINGGIIVSKHSINKDFLKMNNIDKSIKLLENNLDDYVATGLDISINIIVSEIRFKIEGCIGPIPLNNSKSGTSSMRSLNRPQSSSTAISNETNFTSSSVTHNESIVYNYESLESLPLNNGKCSDWCFIFSNVLRNHFEILKDSIDKCIIEVFKQELGDRLINLLIELILKKFKISFYGGMQFSYDINVLYNFYKIEKIKPAVEYLIGFKKIDEIYLIDCSSPDKKEFKKQCKDLGKLVVDLGRSNNVFSPEQVYHFLTRRNDWNRIKKYIDKVVYGFGSEDCIIA